MNLIPQNAEQLELNGATVPFYKYEEDGLRILQFDTSKSGHPEPMVNAMVGLQNLSDCDKLVMINSKPPMGLYPKVEADFNFSDEMLAEGLYKITFTKKGEPANTDFSDTACNG